MLRADLSSATVLSHLARFQLEPHLGQHLGVYMQPPTQGPRNAHLDNHVGVTLAYEVLRPQRLDPHKVHGEHAGGPRGLGAAGDELHLSRGAVWKPWGWRGLGVQWAPEVPCHAVRLHATRVRVSAHERTHSRARLQTQPGMHA